MIVNTYIKGEVFMKKWLAMLLSLVLLLCLCACGKETKKSDDDEDAKASEGLENTEAAAVEMPEDFKNAFVYNTEKGTFLYKPQTGESIKIGDETFSDGGVVLGDGKTLLASFDGQFFLREIGSDGSGHIIGSEKMSGVNITADGKTVFIVDENVLKKYTISTDTFTEIASNAGDFVISPDGKAVVYATNDSKLYYYNGTATLIADDIYGFTDYISPDLSEIVYIKEGKAMLFTPESGNKQIFDGSADSCYVVNKNSIYIIAQSETYMTQAYYYDGQNVTKISDNVFSLDFRNGRLYYTEFEQQEYGISDRGSLCIADGAKILKNEIGHIDNMTPTKSGKNVFYIEEGNLYKVAVGTESMSEPQLIKRDVMSYSLLTVGESIVYENIIDEDDSEVYVDGKLLCDNGSYNYTPYDNGMFFYVNKGAIYRYSGGETTLVFEGTGEDNVGTHEFSDGTLIYFVVDTAGSGEKADIYYWNGSESKLVVKAATRYSELISPADVHNLDLMGELSVYISESEDSGDGYGDGSHDIEMPPQYEGNENVNQPGGDDDIDLDDLLEIRPGTGGNYTDEDDNKEEGYPAYRAIYDSHDKCYYIYDEDGNFVRTFGDEELHKSWGDTAWVTMPSHDSNIVVLLYR